jgi:hypothetical protein
VPVGACPWPLAGFWGFMAASSLILGALVALTGRLHGRALALTIGFGVGALVSAVAYDLVEEAVRVSVTGVSIAVGFVAGALTYFIGDEIIDRMQGPSEADAGSGLPILTLVADDLLPAAHGESDKLVGLATAAGFAVAAFLTFTG